MLLRWRLRPTRVRNQPILTYLDATPDNPAITPPIPNTAAKTPTRPTYLDADDPGRNSAGIAAETGPQHTISHAPGPIADLQRRRSFRRHPNQQINAARTRATGHASAWAHPSKAKDRSVAQKYIFTLMGAAETDVPTKNSHHNCPSRTRANHLKDGPSAAPGGLQQALPQNDIRAVSHCGGYPELINPSGLGIAEQLRLLDVLEGCRKDGGSDLGLTRRAGSLAGRITDVWKHSISWLLRNWIIGSWPSNCWAGQGTRRRFGGPDELLSQLTKNVLETALEARMSEHLGTTEHDPAGQGSGIPQRHGQRRC